MHLILHCINTLSYCVNSTSVIQSIIVYAVLFCRKSSAQHSGGNIATEVSAIVGHFKQQNLGASTRAVGHSDAGECHCRCGSDALSQLRCLYVTFLTCTGGGVSPGEAMYRRQTPWVFHSSARGLVLLLLR